MGTAKEIASKFKIRASSALDIMGETGLTDKQKDELKTLEDRFNGIGKPLTNIQNIKRKELIEKRDNPEIPTGAKTYCKKWLKEHLFNRREELKNKYINKGNSTEEDGFTLMAVQLKLGMVYKNTERKGNDWMTGECDLHLPGNIYDNKASWSLDTFPMFETEIDKKYWVQLQVYGSIWDVKNLNLCYTLNDLQDEEVHNMVKWEIDHDKRYEISNRLVYTSESFERVKSLYFDQSTLETFVPIPDEKRIKHFKFDRDDEYIEKIKSRVEECRIFIEDLLIQNGY